MSGLVVVVLLIVLLYMLYNFMNKNRCPSSRKYKRIYKMKYNSDSDSDEDSDNTLNEKESSIEMYRQPIYDDTSRINNRMFWMSDYSQPGQDNLPSLNNEIITPIKPVTGQDALRYLSGVHQISRYCTEKS
jgi:hypothetical protein